MNSTLPNNSGRKPLRALAAGFTLIEVMISLVILAFISIGIYEATTETYRLRSTLSDEGDFYNGVRLAMDVVRSDVELMYSPTLLTAQPSPSPSPGAPAAPAAAAAAENQAPQLTPQQAQVLGNFGLLQTTKYWCAATDASGLRPMHFLGTDSKMSFISLSNVRIYKGSPESEMSKVSYELSKEDPNSVGATPGAPADLADAQVLMKTQSPNVFEEDDAQDKQLRTIPLLHGIKKFKLSYYRRDRDQTVANWDSDQEDTKNIYPDLIILTVDVAGPDHMTFSGTFKFRPEAPLNGLDATI